MKSHDLIDDFIVAAVLTIAFTGMVMVGMFMGYDTGEAEGYKACLIEHVIEVKK